MLIFFYFKVTGDNLSSLILFDYDSNDQNELIVGSDDSDIRVFKNDELISEMSENSVMLSDCENNSQA